MKQISWLLSSREIRALTGVLRLSPCGGGAGAGGGGSGLWSAVGVRGAGGQKEIVEDRETCLPNRILGIEGPETRASGARATKGHVGRSWDGPQGLGAASGAFSKLLQRVGMRMGS